MSPGRAISCTHVQDMMDDYRRGKLLPGQRQMIEEHLQSCSACQTELEAREALASHMQSALPAASAPQELSPAVLAAITAATHNGDSRPRRQGSPLLPIMLTAAAVLVLAIAMYQVKQPASRESVIALHREDDLAYRELRPAASLETATDKAASEAAPELAGEVAPPPEAAFDADRTVADSVQTKAEGRAMALADRSEESSYYNAPPAAVPPPQRPMSVAGAVQESQLPPEARAMARRQSFAGAPPQPAQAQYQAQDAAAPVPQAPQKAEMAQTFSASPAATPAAEVARAAEDRETKQRFFAKEAPAAGAVFSTSTLGTTATALNTTATSTLTTATTSSREGAQP